MNSSDLPQTIPELFEHAVKNYADKLAIIDDRKRMTFLDLDDIRRQAARSFIALGLKKGDRAAIWAPNIHEYVIVAAALQSVGGILVPLNTRFRAQEASDILLRGRARWLFTVDTFLGTCYPALLKNAQLPDLEKTILLRGESNHGRELSWEVFIGLGNRVDSDVLESYMKAVSRDDILDLMFTSGTTGRPKAAISTHGASLRTYWMFTEQTTLCADDIYLVINPFFHTFGYKYGWLACIMRGASMIPLQTMNVRRVFELIQNERVTMIPAPPTVYQMMLDADDRDQFDLSSLRMGQTGAAVIPIDLIQRMKNELGLDFILTGYGLTESCGIATSTQVDDPIEIVATTVGRPCPGIELHIVDSNGQKLPAGQPGEICLRGDNIMVGYLDDSQATEAVIDKDGFLHTGDMGILDENGNLRILDRLKDMLIVGGFNVYPAEVENVIQQFPGVFQVAVIGIPEPRLGEVAKAFIVPHPNVDLCKEDIISWCRDRIANFKVPREIQLIDSMPLNASGKVLKTELRNL